jgi:poly(3-hydroxybutyrate) depolymerase
MPSTHLIQRTIRRTFLIAAIVCVTSAALSTARAATPRGETTTVAELEIHYQANGDRTRIAYVLLPRWYGPDDDPPVPLVIAPHGAGPGPFLELARAWGDLPARGGFAVVIPEGQGRVLAHYSWGYPGQIDDLARMPAIVRRVIPWLHVDRGRVYAVGGSMGGQESLLLAARHPRLLAGVVSFDAPGDMALRYQQYAELPDGTFMQGLLRTEIGGTPDQDPAAYAVRSPVAAATALARSDVPVQIWWSTRDRLVVDQRLHSGRLYAELRRLNPEARVTEVVGTWPHTAEMRWDRRLPDALRFLGLLGP